jgi:transcriptional regulator with XRE-family HTH domain
MYLSLDVQNASKNIGANLRTWRILLDLTAEQVSQRAGISRVTYSKIENGDFSVSSNTLLAVLRGLGLLKGFEEVTDPYNSDLGRARADQALPKRVR